MLEEKDYFPEKNQRETLEPNNLRYEKPRSIANYKAGLMQSAGSGVVLKTKPIYFLKLQDSSSRGFARDPGGFWQPADGLRRTDTYVAVRLTIFALSIILLRHREG